MFMDSMSKTDIENLKEVPYMEKMEGDKNIFLVYDSDSFNQCCLIFADEFEDGNPFKENPIEIMF